LCAAQRGMPGPRQPLPILQRPAKLTFRAKRSHAELHLAARTIQHVARQNIRRKWFDSLQEGRTKIYVQKHTAAALDGAAVLMQSAYRRRVARQTRQDKVDERQVDEYNRMRAQKNMTFKPRFPPSYYRASAALIQTSIRARKEPKSGKSLKANALFRWATLRRYYRAGGVRTAVSAFDLPPIVFKPHLSQADAQRVRALRARSTSTAQCGSGAGASGSTAASPGSSTSLPSHAAAETSNAAPQLPGLSAVVAEPIMAVPEWLDATAESQQQAESAFLLADTSGDGLVDEAELVALIMKLLKEEDRAKIETFVVQFRPEDGTEISLDFDDFVDVYNRFMKLRECGIC